MTIQDLARRARVTPRTIRYYVEQGVIPPPGRGRPAEYTGEHLRRLNLVRKLKEQYLPLEEIRDTMQRLTLDEVDELLAQSSQERGDASPTTSASEYITSVLNQTAIREEMKRKAPPLPAPAPGVGYQVSGAGIDDRRQATSDRYRHPSLVTRHSSLTQLEQTGTWRRITIAPGIELHFVETDDALTNSIAAQILTAAQDILEINSGEITEETE